MPDSAVNATWLPLDCKPSNAATYGTFPINEYIPLAIELNIVAAKRKGIYPSAPQQHASII